MAGLEALTESLDHCETPSCSSQLHSDSEVQDANSVPDQPMAHASDSASIGTALKQQPISIAEPAGKAPSLPKLHSNPGATKRIYLDFDGHTTTGTLWNNWVGGSPIVSPPYSLDSVQSTNFTAVELDKIQEIYQRVAEDFLPFDVDVTTEEPPIGALLKSGSGDQEWGIRVVIGGDNRDWFNPNGKGYIGGVAYGGSFNWSTDTPTFVWSEDVRPGWRGDAYHIAAKVSHEVGHTLGLGHQKVSGGAIIAVTALAQLRGVP